ncbi:MAG: hypothetical protein GC204_09265 [Chloroflexi bacterium]|nr:hypothetical protein [Chloroflexota bacterium]
MDPIQRLRDVKLVVIGGNGIYRIFKPAPDSEVGYEFNFIGWSSDSPEVNSTIKLSDRRGLLYFENNLWVFRVWDATPGPGPEDFAYGYQDLDRVVDAVVNFYEGEPTSIGDWLVPLHRHPYLEIEAVRHSIGLAKVIPENGFNDLKNERTAKFHAENNAKLSTQWLILDRPQAIMRLQFIECRHVTDAKRTLFLRRDAGEAYLVTADEATL